MFNVGIEITAICRSLFQVFMSQWIRRFAIGIPVLCTGVGIPLVEAQVSDAKISSGLIERSPFLPADIPPAEEKAPLQERRNQNPLSQQFEFRGFYQINGKYRFLVKEKSKPTGYWIEIEDPDAEYIIRQFNPSDSSILLAYNGQEETIPLNQLASSSTPIPVSGQLPRTIPGQKVASTPSAGPPNAPIIVGAASTSDTTGGASNVRRRTPPPPPDWIRKRIEESGTRVSQAMLENIAKGPPNVNPGPPPNNIPDLPEGGLPDFATNDNPTPSSTPSFSNSDILNPPQMTPSSPQPNFIPDFPPGN